MGGNFKQSGKIAHQVVPFQKEYMQLMIKVGRKEEILLAMRGSFPIRDTQKEVTLGQKIQSKYVDQAMVGKVFIKDNEQQNLSFYTPLAEGGSLAKFISKKKLPLEKQSEIINQIMLGLKDIHNKGYVHQDLRADNVLLDQMDNSLNIRIADLGSTVEEGGKLKGFLECFSPEEAENFHDDQAAHPANDMWALGMLIWKIRNPDKEIDFIDPIARMYFPQPKETSIHDKKKLEQFRKEIYQDPLFRGLFASEREERLNIEEALQLFNTQVELQKQNELSEDEKLKTIEALYEKIMKNKKFEHEKREKERIQKEREAHEREREAQVKQNIKHDDIFYPMLNDAIKQNNKDSVLKLLKLRLNIDSFDINNLSKTNPVNWVVFNFKNFNAILRYLIPIQKIVVKGKTINGLGYSFLMQAIEMGVDKDVLELILKNLTISNDKFKSSYVNYKILIPEKVDVYKGGKISPSYSISALVLAIINQNFDQVEVLLKHGAQCNEENLSLARKNGNDKITKLIMAHLAQPQKDFIPSKSKPHVPASKSEKEPESPSKPPTPPKTSLY